MKYFGFVFISFFTFSFASAYLPLQVEQESVRDVTEIINPEMEQIFYGDLENFPHMYKITTDSPLDLFIEISVPDIESSKDNLSGIIIKEIEGSGRVIEVARLKADTAVWEKWDESVTNDTYRRGPVFQTEISAGVYRIEVSTPDNIEKYVLKIGTEKNTTKIGYFETLQRIAEVKVFFEKSKFRIIESPHVYVPVFLLVFLISAVWFVKRKRSLKVV